MKSRHLIIAALLAMPGVILSLNGVCYALFLWTFLPSVPADIPADIGMLRLFVWFGSYGAAFAYLTFPRDQS
jgi:hypothetical protein